MNETLLQDYWEDTGQNTYPEFTCEEILEIAEEIV